MSEAVHHDGGRARPGLLAGSELGNLGLTDEEEDAIAAFLETLTDDFF